jgi:hypothetical protein
VVGVDQGVDQAGADKSRTAGYERPHRPIVPEVAPR